MSWDLEFPVALPVPKGKPLETLRDAGNYIVRLPGEWQINPAWQNAMHVLIQAADHGGPVEFARLGMMQALHPKPEPVYRSASKDPKWRDNYRLVRDR